MHKMYVVGNMSARELAKHTPRLGGGYGVSLSLLYKILNREA